MMRAPQRPNDIPTIVLSGLASLQNRGVEALLIASARELRERLPDASIQVLRRSVDRESDRLDGLGLDFVGERERPGGRLAAVTRRFGSKSGSDTGGGSGELLRAADLVIASGGDTFSRHYPGMHGHLRKLEAAMEAGVPVSFLALSVGPFSDDADARAWSTVARRAASITVREDISYAYVTGTLGIPAELVERTADPAFLLELPSETVLGRLRAAHGMANGETVVGIAPSQSIARLAGVDPEQHLVAWLALVRFLLDEMGVHVLVVPHAHGRNAEADDRVIAEAIASRVGPDARLTVARDPALGAVAYKGLLSGCQLVVAERMHAAIAGLSSGVPTVAVGYSIKAAGIIRQVMGSELGDRALLTVERFTDPGTATDFVRDAWASRPALAARIAATLPDVQRLARRNFDIVAGLVAPGRV